MKALGEIYMSGRLDVAKDSVSGDSGYSNLNDINLRTLNKLTGY